MSRERVVPSARVPRPRQALRREPLADGGERLPGHEVRRVLDLRRVRRVHRVARVDHVAVGRHRAILHQHALVVEDGAQRGGRVLPFGRARAHEPEVVEERAAERAHEEIVGEGVLAREPAQGQVGRVVVAHHEAARLGPRDEAVVLPAVDLQPVLVVEVDRDCPPFLPAGRTCRGRRAHWAGSPGCAGRACRGARSRAGAPRRRGRSCRSGAAHRRRSRARWRRETSRTGRRSSSSPGRAPPRARSSRCPGARAAPKRIRRASSATNPAAIRFMSLTPSRGWIRRSRASSRARRCP